MEQVFCVRRQDLEMLFGGRLPQGTAKKPDLSEIFNLKHCFLPREQAEQDPACKQIIPYQLFVCSDHFFVYQRGGGVGEQRLSGRCSLGIGGHINHQDADAPSLCMAAYRNAMLRERHEELLCPTDIKEKFIGWINDDSDPVGQVHLGAVHLCRVNSEADIMIRPGEEDIHLKGWLRADQIHACRERFEQWSLLALDLALAGFEKAG